MQQLVEGPGRGELCAAAAEERERGFVSLHGWMTEESAPGFEGLAGPSESFVRTILNNSAGTPAARPRGHNGNPRHPHCVVVFVGEPAKGSQGKKHSGA